MSRSEIRRLFGHVRELVENHYKHEQGRPKELPWQSVSAFCFLRFIIPAILHPYQFGLYPGTWIENSVLCGLTNIQALLVHPFSAPSP